MEISAEDYEKIYKVDKTFKASGMKPLSGEDMKALAEQLLSGQPFKAQAHWQGGAPGNSPPAGPAGIPGQMPPSGQPPAPMAPEAPTAPEGGLPPEIAGGLTPPPPETSGGLSKLPKGKGKTTVETDESGRVTKITQILTPGLGGINSNVG